MYCDSWASQLVLVVKNPSANAGDIRDMGSIPGSGKQNKQTGEYIPNKKKQDKTPEKSKNQLMKQR